MDQMTRIEWKLDQVLAALAVGRGREGLATESPPVEAREHGEGRVDLMAKLTTKQHAAFQMLLAGCRNRAIAERFGVTENTAKVHVRGIAGKLGVRTRSEIVMKLWSAFREIDDNSYRLMSGGLPKDWHKEFSEPDPFAHLYRREDDGTETDT